MKGPFAEALARAVRDSRADDVPLLMAGALRTGEAWDDVAGACLQAAARAVDFSGGRNLHGVLSLVAAARLARQVPYEAGFVPVGQSVYYLATQPKWSSPPGWVERLRDGPPPDELDLPSAVALAAARDDPALVEEAVRAIVHQASHFGGNWGHTLIFATMTYDAGAELGWDVAAPLFAACVEHVLPSDRDESAHEAVWAVFERANLDFSQVAAAAPTRSGDDELEKLRKALRRPSRDEAAGTVGAAVERGVSPDVLLDALALSGADKMLRTSYGMAAAHALTFAHAVRRAVAIQRDGCTIGAIAVAAAFMGSQVEVYDRRAEGARAGPARGEAPNAVAFASLLREGPLAEAVEAARAVGASGHATDRAYVRAVVEAASADDLLLSVGINIKHAEAALSEATRPGAPDPSPFLMAVAKNLVASERGTGVRDRLQAAAAGPQARRG